MCNRRFTQSDKKRIAAETALDDFKKNEVPKIEARAIEKAKAEFIKTYEDGKKQSTAVPQGIPSVSRTNKGSISLSRASKELYDR